MLSLSQQNRLRQRYRQRRPDWRPATEQYADLVRQHLAEFDAPRLLDLGCGRGGLVEQLGLPLAQMVGVDPDVVSLREHRLGVPRAAGFSDALPFAANSFDVVFSSWLLEHLAQPAQTFAAIGRALRPGGKFVFITPNGRHPLALLNRGLGRFARLQGELVARTYGRAPADTFPTHYRANTAADLERLCAQTGLRLATLLTIPDPTYLAFTPALFRLSCVLEEWLPDGRRVHLVGVVEA